MKTDRLSGRFVSICTNWRNDVTDPETTKFQLLEKQQQQQHNFKEAINTPSDNSTLCLFAAVEGGYRSIINYLLDNGANPLLRQTSYLDGLKDNNINLVEYLIRLRPLRKPGTRKSQGIDSMIQDNVERFDIVEDILTKVSARSLPDAIGIRRAVYHAIVNTRDEFGGDSVIWSKYLGREGDFEQDKQNARNFIRLGDASEGAELIQSYISLQDRMRNELENEYKVGLEDEKPQTFFESVSSNLSYFASNLLGYNTQARDSEDTVPLAKEFDSKAKSARQEEQPLLPRAQREVPIPAEAKQQSQTGELRQRKVTQNPEQNSF